MHARCAVSSNTHCASVSCCDVQWDLSEKTEGWCYFVLPAAVSDLAYNSQRPFDKPSIWCASGLITLILPFSLLCPATRYTYMPMSSIISAPSHLVMYMYIRNTANIILRQFQFSASTTGHFSVEHMTNWRQWMGIRWQKTWDLVHCLRSSVAKTVPDLLSQRHSPGATCIPSCRQVIRCWRDIGRYYYSKMGIVLVLAPFCALFGRVNTFPYTLIFFLVDALLRQHQRHLYTFLYWRYHSTSFSAFVSSLVTIQKTTVCNLFFSKWRGFSMHVANVPDMGTNTN